MIDETLDQVKTQNHTIFNRLKLHMLGSPEIIWLDQPYEIARRQARALLSLIGSSFPQPITRSKLAFLIWSVISVVSVGHVITIISPIL